MLVIIRGLPGSGKTTLARMYEAEGYVHIEKDIYRVNDAGDYEYNEANNPALEQQCLDNVQRHLRRGRDVVVSNCNEILSCVDRYINMAVWYKQPYTVIECKGRLGSVHGSDADVGRERRKAAWQSYPV